MHVPLYVHTRTFKTNIHGLLRTNNRNRSINRKFPLCVYVKQDKLTVMLASGDRLGCSPMKKIPLCDIMGLSTQPCHHGFLVVLIVLHAKCILFRVLL
jgi:hypothetical protein